MSGAARSLSTLALVALAAGAASAATPNAYDLWIVESLPGGSIPECYVFDVNESGVACGTSTMDSFYSGFTWTEAADKTPIPLVWVEDVNDLDQVAGDSGVWDPAAGTVTWIPGLSSYWATPYVHGLNDVGTVVGHAKGPGSDSDGVNRTPLVWDAIHGVRGIAVPGARELLRVNDANVAVGNIRHSAGDSEAFVYRIDTGTAVLLHELLSPGGAGTSSAWAVNEAGTVLGKGWNGTANHAFLWSEAAGFEFLPALGGGETMRVNPAALNDLDQAVGSALDGVTGDWQAFLWDPVEGMHNLNDKIDPASGFILDRARGINNAGVIVGDGHFGPGFGLPRGFVLVPQGSGTVDAPALAGAVPVERLRLAPGSANPARDGFEFEFDLPRDGDVRLSVHDVLGRRVSVLAEGPRAPGRHRARWSGGAPDGSSAAPGVYFVRLETASGADVLRVTRLR